MKKRIGFCLVVAAIFFMLSGSAMAVTYTWGDAYTTFPGYPVQAGIDEIGAPQIASISVTIGDTGYLESVSLDIANRVLWDSLFINANMAAGEQWDAWDYYVFGGFSGGGDVYEVGQYEYFLATSGRTGHPAGIQSQYLTFDKRRLDVLTAMSYDGSTLLYSFAANKIYMGSGMNFLVAYTPYCANDVILTPEPMSLLLLGLGLIGIAGIRRKF